jgi:hypothetical protein
LSASAAAGPAAGDASWETLEVLTVGLPFCVFKFAAGAALLGDGGLAAAAGRALVALGAVDVLFNLANLGGLLAVRRRVFDACFLSLAAHRLRPAVRRSSWALRDLGNSFDVLLSFSLVAYMVGAGRLGGLPPRILSWWNVAVVCNVLGAGLGRLAESLRRL